MERVGDGSVLKQNGALSLGIEVIHREIPDPQQSKQLNLTSISGFDFNGSLVSTKLSERLGSGDTGRTKSFPSNEGVMGWRTRREGTASGQKRGGEGDGV